jgi:hypothetical protein
MQPAVKNPDENPCCEPVVALVYVLRPRQWLQTQTCTRRDKPAGMLSLSSHVPMALSAAYAEAYRSAQWILYAEPERQNRARNVTLKCQLFIFESGPAEAFLPLASSNTPWLPSPISVKSDRPNALYANCVAP